MSGRGGAAVCARCGEYLWLTAERCPVCQVSVARSVLPMPAVGPLASGATSATAARRALSLAVSIAACLLVAGIAAAVAWPGGATVAVGAAVLGIVAAAAVQLALWVHTGRALGNLVTSTRTVRADDGTAVSWRALGFRSRVIPAPGVAQGPVTRALGAATVVRAGQRDPLTLALRGPATLPPRIPGAVARQRALHAITLVFDGRLRIPLTRATVLGRNPPAGPADVAVVALPDLSRSISKSHVRLEREGERVYAQDLGSTNGTQLVTPEGVTDLAEGQRVEIPTGAHLLLSGVPLRLDRGQQGVAA